MGADNTGGSEQNRKKFDSEVLIKDKICLSTSSTNSTSINYMRSSHGIVVCYAMCSSAKY